MLLHHITLATGHTATHRADTFAPEAVQACRDLLPDGGPVPGVPGFHVEITQNVFTISREEIPLVTCGHGKGQEDLWDTLVGLQERFVPVKVSCPKRGLWLGVVLLPTLYSATKEDVIWMADFERCLAAAMITAE